MLTNLRDAFSSQSRSPNIVPFHKLGIVYSCAIVTLSLRGGRRFYDIRLQKMSWPWNRGQRSLKFIESGTIRKIVYGFLLLFFSNVVPKTHRFWDIRLQNCYDLDNRVRGPSRSLQMSPCDRAHMTSYWRSIVTMALSHVVSELFNVEKCCDLEIGVKCHSSLRVVLFDTSRRYRTWRLASCIILLVTVGFRFPIFVLTISFAVLCRYATLYIL